MINSLINRLLYQWQCRFKSWQSLLASCYVPLRKSLHKLSAFDQLPRSALLEACRPCEPLSQLSLRSWATKTCENAVNSPTPSLHRTSFYLQPHRFPIISPERHFRVQYFVVFGYASNMFRIPFSNRKSGNNLDKSQFVHFLRFLSHCYGKFMEQVCLKA